MQRQPRFSGIEAGLPDEYTDWQNDDVKSGLDKKRIFNFLQQQTIDERGGLLVLRASGKLVDKGPFPVEIVPLGSVAITVQSFFPAINPNDVIAGKKIITPFAAGISSGTTKFSAGSGAKQHDELNLIRASGSMPGSRIRDEACWQYLFDAAKLIEAQDVAYSLLATRFTPPPGEDILSRLDDFLAEE